MNCSDRLNYREITLEDAPLIVKWRSDPSVYKYFTRPHKITVDEHVNWFNNSYKNDSNRIDFMALDRDGKPVGIFGIRRDDSAPFEAEVSYIIDPEFYGQGYGSEGVRWLVSKCGEIWNCRAVTAEIHKDNVSSVNLVKKLGFTEQKTNGNFVIYGREL